MPIGSKFRQSCNWRRLSLILTSLAWCNSATLDGVCVQNYRIVFFALSVYLLTYIHRAENMLAELNSFWFWAKWARKSASLSVCLIWASRLVIAVLSRFTSCFSFLVWCFLVVLRFWRLWLYFRLIWQTVNFVVLFMFCFFRYRKWQITQLIKA